MYLSKHFSRGNCGMELFGFYGSFDKADAKKGWSWPMFVKLMGQGRYWIGGIVFFSGNGSQKRQNLGPHSFATWLKKEGEKVTEGEWARNGSSKIKAYLWSPSKEFLGRLKQEQSIYPWPKPTYDPYSQSYRS